METEGVVISSLIVKLEALKEEHGDVKVRAKNETGLLDRILTRDVYVFAGEVVIDV